MALSPTAQSRLPNQEQLLLDYIHRLETHRRGRTAAHVHLSRLKPHNRRDHHIRVAANTFEGLVRDLHGQLFVLKNSDLFFIYKDEAQNDVETSLLRLKFLFSDDPLLAEDDESRFCTYYHVDRDYDEILSLVRRLVHDETETDEEPEPADEHDAKSALQLRQERGEPLSPRVLGRVEQSLQRADLSNLVRRQYVCGLVGKATPQPFFSELFISIRDLRETLLPGVDISSSRWLFQHLTETLDRRVLSMLAKSNDRSITGEISVNLNVSTILSPEFMQFDDSVIASMRGSIVIELQKVDIFADINAFIFAREFAKERGYRICIDGLTYETMPFINRERLGADMIKLVWDAEVMEEVGHQAIAERVKSAGGSRVILCRCDDEAAVDFGQAVGVKMFQGRYIEGLIAEETRRREMEMVRRRSGGEFIE